VKTQVAKRKLSNQNELFTQPVVPQKFNLALAQVVEMPKNSRTIDESEAISPLMDQYRTLDKIQQLKNQLISKDEELKTLKR
jgi:hypothetical protein